ncbi:polysaccharide biosynthesis/export family protein [Roseivivax sediminis]|uniref:Protein involved in polysaccharide export, contains SLBB domain of the beta-grasp fold n=1 Tax=Roseivivax sediminis TaxID=936889 RepID=A0A1I1X0F5_9RHOB|nr:polysaccharide biosynthesis/export family protein [Roseivivax sediminis]SFE00866.1 protein involved in polysaccharide export, contains SLBB domain of the beta-grasp fold [Roseivivax sediminis]
MTRLVFCRAAVFGLSVLALASGCAAPRTAQNLEPVSRGAGYQAQWRDLVRPPADPPVLRAAEMNAAGCRPFAGGPGDGRGGAKLGTRVPAQLSGETLSRGDLLDLRLPDEETFTGDYVVSRDGTLKVPFLRPIRAEGRTPEAVAADLRSALVAGEFYDETPELSLLVTDLASVRVAVSGAVFEPQPVEIGNVSGQDRDARRQAALGASTEGRNLSVAIRSAGGIRPDADLSAVQLTRGGSVYTLDLRGVMEGRAVPDVILASGDEVHVPSRQCFQDDLMRPSPISPPGIALYLSNLTVPATGNAPSAIGQEVREVPYGTRYMQAVVDANCVGGARASSAARSAALFTRNPVTGVSVVIERSVEEMRARADRDDYDPYLLPGDAIACYDSGVTNLTEVARVVGIVGAAGLVVR